jgi:hypothetical protein
MVPKLLQSMDSSNKSATIQAALNLLQKAAIKAPMQVAQCLPEIVPVVSGPMTDMVASVSEQAIATMTQCCSAVDNKDIYAAIPKVRFYEPFAKLLMMRESVVEGELRERGVGATRWRVRPKPNLLCL